MTINKQLTILMLLITLFSIIVAVSTFKISQASRLHQLNSMHFNYVIELRELIDNTQNDIPNITTLKKVIKNIEAQPAACLALPDAIDLFLMRLTKTESILSICQNDVDVAQDLLAKIDLFEAGLVTQIEMQTLLEDCYNDFRNNSIDFIKPVDKFTEFILNTSTSLIIILSVAFFLIALGIAKAISNIVKNMQKTSDELVTSEAKNRLIAYKDTLTDLPNRNALNINIKKMINTAENKKFAILFIDLDRFKDVNDTRGHAQGDKLLIAIAKRLFDVVATNGTVFRFGGDEFVALIQFDEIEEVNRIAKHLVLSISKPILLTKAEVHVTASIGISIYPLNAYDAESLIKYADTAMYQAKKEGKNKYLFYQETFSKEHALRLSYESQLRSAIPKGQLKIVYQPIVDLTTLETKGTEALLRWHLDDDTIIPPDIFIPIAEYSGQIIEIGEWVLRHACHQNKIWRDSGAKNLTIAVNVSPFQLYHPNFTKSVQDVILEFDIPYHCLEIEITESMTISENDCFLNTLNELSKMGVRLLMDDFGTGYSCLSYLRTLPFNVLKIDKSFVTEYDTIASTIIAMGKQLDMKIIAEGVETQQALTKLQQQQCDYAQGYFFQRPISPEQLDIFKVYKLDPE
jgi:diguanylate cyclase (GGDEF)-like protein